MGTALFGESPIWVVSCHMEAHFSSDRASTGSASVSQNQCESVCGESLKPLPIRFEHQEFPALHLAVVEVAHREQIDPGGDRLTFLGDQIPGERGAREIGGR